MTLAPTKARRRLRPTLWPTVTTVIIAVLLIGLGSWQMQRRSWKEGLMTDIATRLHQPPVPLPAAIDDPEAWRYRPVTVTGTLDNTHEMPIVAFSKTGEQGYMIVTPLIRPDGTAVLFNRGWVPTDKHDPASRPQGQLTGMITITGMARPGWPQGWFVPDNDTVKNIWFWGDIAAMAKASGQAKTLPLYVEADSTPNPGGLPIGGQSVVNLRNDHLQYAITWYALAIGIVVIWFLYHWTPEQEDADKA